MPANTIGKCLCRVIARNFLLFSYFFDLMGNIAYAQESTIHAKCIENDIEVPGIRT